MKAREHSSLLLGLKLNLIDHAWVSCLDSSTKLVMQVHPVLGPRNKLTCVGLLEEVKNIQQISPEHFHR
ncbi:hypothetical protein EJB05_57938, partial [Eragrostis curvula]